MSDVVYYRYHAPARRYRMPVPAGHSVSIADLDRHIKDTKMASLGAGRRAEIALLFYDPRTGEEYAGDDVRIPAGSTVAVRLLDMWSAVFRGSKRAAEFERLAAETRARGTTEKAAAQSRAPWVRDPAAAAKRPPRPRTMEAEADSGFFHLPAGFRFSPTPIQILRFYLGPKISGVLPSEVESVIPTVDLFTSNAPPPSSIHPAASWIPDYPYHSITAPKNVHDWFYCFTRITPRGSGFCRVSLRGTWVASGRDKPIKKGGKILGYKTALAFRTPDAADAGSGKSTVNTGWVMTEFKFRRGEDAAKEEMLVLCMIRCINRRTSQKENFILPADPWAMQLDVRQIMPEELSDSSARTTVTTAMAAPPQAVYGSWGEDGCSCDLVGANGSEAPCSFTEEVPAVEEEEAVVSMLQADLGSPPPPGYDDAPGHPAQPAEEATGVASGQSDAVSHSDTRSCRWPMSRKQFGSGRAST